MENIKEKKFDKLNAKELADIKGGEEQPHKFELFHILEDGSSNYYVRDRRWQAWTLHGTD